MSLDGQALDDVTDVQRLMAAELIGKRVEAIAIRAANPRSSRCPGPQPSRTDRPSRRAALYDHARVAGGEMDLRPDRAGRPGRRLDALAQADPTPFSLHAWYSAWWDGYGADRELRYWTVRGWSVLAGLLPLCRRGGRTRGDGQSGELRRAPARARPRGAGAARRRRRARALRADGDPPPAGGRRGHRRARRRGARGGAAQHRGARHHLTDRRVRPGRSTRTARRPAGSGTRTYAACTARCCAITTPG